MRSHTHPARLLGLLFVLIVPFATDCDGPEPGPRNLDATSNARADQIMWSTR